MRVTAEGVGVEDLGRIECTSAWRTELGQRSVSFAIVGHVITAREITVDPERVLYWDYGRRPNTPRRFRHMLFLRAGLIIAPEEYDQTLAIALAEAVTAGTAPIPAARLRSLRGKIQRYQEEGLDAASPCVLGTANVRIYLSYQPPQTEALDLIQNYLLANIDLDDQVASP